MTDSIQVVVDPNTFDTAGTAQRLIMRHIGKWGRATMVLVPASVYILGMVLFDTLTDLDMWRGVGIASVFLLYAFIVAFILNNQRIHRSLKRQAAAADYKQPALTFTLSEQGVRGGAMEARWDQVQSVERVKSTTALKLTPMYYVVLPDHGIQGGITPEHLLARIAEWRTNAR